jgi:hypothetical protein
MGTGESQATRRHPKGKPPDVDRRIHPRHPAAFAAEVTEAISGAQITSRTNDVSMGGCFLDTPSPLQVGAPVRIVLAREGKTFEARGSVVYAQNGLGIGISFLHVSPENRGTLNGWLAREMQLPPHFGTALPESSAAQFIDPGKAAMGRLVQILVKRGILTAQEGEEVQQLEMP